MPKLYMEQLTYMTAVTQLLNGSDLPKSNEYEVKVLLTDSETGKIVAKWDNEHFDNDWSIEFVDPEPDEESTVV